MHQGKETTLVHTPIFNQNPPFTVSSSQQTPKAISKGTQRLAGQKCLQVLVRSYKLSEFGFGVELKF